MRNHDSRISAVKTATNCTRGVEWLSTTLEFQCEVSCDRCERIIGELYVFEHVC